MRTLLFVNVMIGLWLASVYVYVFAVIVKGGTVGEPDTVIAKTEFWLSIVVTCWFLWQVSYWVIRLLREGRAGGLIQSRGKEGPIEGNQERRVQ